MAEKKQPIWKSFWVVFIALTTLIPLAASLGLRYYTGSDRSFALMVVTPMIWVICLLVVVAFGSAILIHELGHLAFGRAAGMRLKTIQVLGFGLATEGSSRHWFKTQTPLGAGSVIMDPETNSPEELVRRYRTFIAGGPLVSVIYAAVLIVLHGFMKQQGKVPPWDWLTLVTFMFMLFAITLLPGTLLPYTSGGMNTDMKLLLILSKKGAVRERFVATTFIGMESAEGTRARDWSESLLQIAIQTEDSSDMEARARLLAYYKAMDLGDAAAALEHVQRAHAVAVKMGKQAGVLLEAAAFELAYALAQTGGDMETAESLVDSQKSPHDLTRGARERALALLAHVRGDSEARAHHVRLAREALDLVQKRYAAPCATERAWLDALENRALETVPERV